MQSVRHNNGLGKLIQSQTLGVDVNGARVNIVQTTAYDGWSRSITQTVLYTYSGSSYSYQSIPSGTAVMA